jgi:hypothetical protein
MSCKVISNLKFKIFKLCLTKEFKRQNSYLIELYEKYNFYVPDFTQHLKPEELERLLVESNLNFFLTYYNLTNFIIAKRYDLIDVILLNSRYDAIKRVIQSWSTKDHNLLLFVVREPSFTLDEKILWIHFLENIYQEHIIEYSHNLLFESLITYDQFDLFFWLCYRFNDVPHEIVYYLFKKQSEEPITSSKQYKYQAFLECVCDNNDTLMILTQIFLGIHRKELSPDLQMLYKDINEYQIDWGTNDWLRNKVQYLILEPINNCTSNKEEQKRLEYMINIFRDHIKEVKMRYTCVKELLEDKITQNVIDYIIKIYMY